jgi:succinoglycan biosynthesis protein ExoA
MQGNKIMPPQVSIIIPCYNEQGTIRNLLYALHNQTFPRTKMEVIISDGQSEDGTLEEIETFKKEHTDLAVRVIQNPARTIPAGVNAAIREARGETILRMDAHSCPYPDYVERCLSALESGLGDNVGGVWEIQPGKDTWVARSIALAAAHPLGVGDAGYRIGAKASEVDTVPYGAFRRSLIDKIGMLDESLLANEDYEFNARIRKAGGRIWLDPEIVTIYYARSTLRGLVKQYWRYGFWKWRMLQRYPRTLRWRQGVPPLFVLSLIGLGLFSWWRLATLLLAMELIVYFGILLLVSVYSTVKYKQLFLIPGMLLSIPAMHISWGGGFLWSMLNSMFGSIKKVWQN